MMSWDEIDGSVSGSANPSDNCNGNTVDRAGTARLVLAPRRAVIRTEHDGSTTVIADSYQGSRLNSPNDVVVQSDGSIWFTDPSYGIDTDYEGARRPRAERLPRLPHRRRHGRGHARRRRLRAPNGLAFSIDEKMLYVADSGRPRRGLPHDIRVFDVVEGDAQGRRGLRRLRARLLRRLPPRRAGHIWTSAGDGVQCFAPDGTLIGKIKLPEGCANVCFGMLRNDRLFMTATTSVYAIYLLVRGHRTF